MSRATTGAERFANSHFLLPGRGAAQHQIGHVRARDQQHETDRGQHDQQVALLIMTDVLQINRVDIRAETRVLSRVFFRHARGDRTHFRSRLLQ